jgi:arsenate reductase
MLERSAERVAHCWHLMDTQIAEPSPYLLGERIGMLDLYVAVMSRWTPCRERFYREAPRMAEVVKRVDAEPRLARVLGRALSVHAGLGTRRVTRVGPRLPDNRAMTRKEATTDYPMTIYHKPNCSTSRNVLSLIRESGVEPEIVEYLKTPPSKKKLRELADAMGLKARELLRTKEEPYAALKLDDPKWSDDQILGFIVEHPILLQRPIVVSPRGTLMCRPWERVREILPAA